MAAWDQFNHETILIEISIGSGSHQQDALSLLLVYHPRAM